jgi:hypothetical protein
MTGAGRRRLAGTGPPAAARAAIAPQRWVVPQLGTRRPPAESVEASGQNGAALNGSTSGRELPAMRLCKRANVLSQRAGDERTGHPSRRPWVASRGRSPLTRRVPFASSCRHDPNPRGRMSSHCLRLIGTGRRALRQAPAGRYVQCSG